MTPAPRGEAMNKSTRLLRLATLAAALAFWPESNADALVSFGAARPLNTLAATDGDASDSEPSVTSAGGGKWLTVWRSSNDLGGTLPADVLHPLFSRSDDDGATWTAPSALELTTSRVTVESDGAGVVIVVGCADFFDVAPNDVEIIRSADGGSTWSLVSALSIPDKPFNSTPVVATDYAGTWVVAWSSGNSVYGSDADIYFVRSDDNGVTWNSAAPLNTDAASDVVDDYWVTVSTDRAGTWVAAWGTFEDEVRVASSVDDGISWTTPVQGAGSGLGYRNLQFDLATNRLGRWLVTWRRSDSAYDNNRAYLVAESMNAGATWGAPVLIDELGLAGIESVRILYAGGGVWDLYGTGSVESLTRGIGEEGDVLHWRSVDDGISWTRASALTRTAAWDDGLTYEPVETDYDSSIDVAGDGSGVWLAVWQSKFDFEPDFGAGNGIGNDDEIVMASAFEKCPAAPASGCTTSSSATGDKISITVVNGGGHKLSWSLAKGTATTLDDLGDPVGGDAEYAFCVWDHVGGNPLLVFETQASAGATGRLAEACWAPKGSGLAYKDKSRRNGPVQRLNLKYGAAGRSVAKLAAGGTTLGVPSMPFAQSPEVVVQVINAENGHCWESRFATSSENSATRFQAR